MINMFIVIILLEVMTIERIMIIDVISKGMLVFSIFVFNYLILFIISNIVYYRMLEVMQRNQLMIIMMLTKKNLLKYQNIILEIL